MKDVSESDSLFKEEEAQKELPAFTGGLLIGFRKDNEPPLIRSPFNASTYRTFWLVHEKGEVRLAQEIPSIVVPYHDQFLKLDIGTENHKANQYKIAKEFQYLNVYPFGESSPPPEEVHALDDKYLYESFRQLNLLFASRDGYLSLVERNYFHLKKEGYHFPLKLIEKLSVQSFPDLAAVSLIDMFGEEAEGWVERYKNQEITMEEVESANTRALDPFDVERSKYAQEDWRKIIQPMSNLTDEHNWTLSRKKGKWVPQIAKRWEEDIQSDYITISRATLYQLYDLSSSFPKSMVNHDELYPDWKTVKNAVPEAIDAVSSPNRKMLAVLTSDQLMVYSYPEQNLLREPDLVLPLQSGESLVMAEWADGSEVKKWSNMLDENKELLK